MDTKEALETLDTVQGLIGNDEEIENITQFLITLKEFLASIDTQIDSLQEDLAHVNEKNRSLLASNNALYKRIGQTQEAIEKANETASVAEEINNLI